MPDDIVEIQIRTTADGSGAKETADAISQVTQAAKADNEVTEEAAKKTGFLSLRKAELKKLVRELGHEFPIAGMAARAMLNPIVAAFSGAIAIFTAAKAKLDEWNAALDESEKFNANRDFLPGIEGKAKAMEEGAIAAANFGEALDAVGKQEDAFTTKVKVAIDKLHEFVTAQAEVNNASEAKELAAASLQQKLGRITETQAIDQRAAIKERYRQTGDALKTQGENQELALKQGQLKHAAEIAPALEFEAGTKRAVVDQLKGRLAASTGLLPGAQKALTEYQKQFDDAQKKADKAQADWLAIPQFMRETMPNREQHPYFLRMQKTQAEADRAQRARDAQSGLIDSYKRDMNDIPVQLLPGAESAAAIAEGKAKSNVGTIVSLDKEIGGLQETLPIRQRGRDISGSIKDQTTEINAAGDLADELKKGQEKQEALQNKVNSVIRSNGQVKQSMLDALDTVADELLATKRELDSKVQQLTQQLGGMRNR